MANEKKKEMLVAEDLFVNKFWPAKDIAESLGLQENTISRWRKKYNWDKTQEDTINNPTKMKTLIAREMIKIASGEKSNIDADALAKMFKVFEGISDRINPGIVAAILKLYNEFLAERDPQFAIKQLDYSKQFLQSIIARNG